MSKFKKFLFPTLLILLTGFICVLNYSPNTFLTGWDNLHPEFNFPLNFKRLIFGVWHSEQGLGTIPAHAQMADLPRVFILYLFHFVLPLNFLRYSYIFLCFILGPLGIYFLIKNIFQKNPQRNLIAFITSLLYIFNLSTIQQFYAPFEMFPTQWAFLPWIVLFSLKYLQENKRHNLILFSIFTIFSAPQAYASQLWYTFFGTYLIFLIIYSLKNKTHFKKTIKLIVFTLLLNSFWLIPNIFYILTSSDAALSSHTNRLSSQEILSTNRQNGNLLDSTLVRGFYFDWQIFNFNKDTYENLMPQWNQHLKNLAVSGIGYLIFIASLYGLIVSFIKKDKLFISFCPFFIIPFVLLSNKVPIFSQFFDLLIKNSTIRESFRFIFTKFSILLIFGIIIFFSYSLSLFFEKIKKIKFIFISSLLIITSFIIYAFPLFQGYLISPKFKINIPNEYFQMWQFMNNLDDGRVLSLPLNSSTGWSFYNWEYQGSGFLWFNLKQDLLDRDFDRWSDKNEQSYKEFINSLYNQNSDQFSNSLKKYQVAYIIWDQNITTASKNNLDKTTLQKEISKTITELENQNLIKKINQFGSIYIYQTNNLSLKSETKTITNFIQPQYQWGYIDAANSQDYITSNSSKSVYFPFRDLMNKNQKIDTNKIGISQLSDNQWQIKLDTNNQIFSIPSITSTEKIISAGIYLTKKSDKFTLKFEFNLPKEITNYFQTEFDLPVDISQIKINDNIFTISTATSNQAYLGIADIFVNSNNLLNDEIINFNFNQETISSLEDITINSNSYNFSNQNIANLPKASHASGYIIGVRNTYFSGLTPRFCLKSNDASFVCEIEDQLNKNKKSSWDYFLIPPINNDFGYQINIFTSQYKGLPSKSLVEQISIIPIPFNFLSQIKSETAKNYSSNFSILNESYNRFWIAFYFKNNKPVFLKNHVIANNWANAWQIPDNYDPSSKIYYLFWPQIFEFLGFGLTIFAFVWSFKKTKIN